MRSRTLAKAMVLLFGSLALFAAAHLLGLQRRADADWLLTRSQAEAAAYTDSFDGRHIDAQLSTLGERRGQLRVALRFDLLRAASAVMAGLAALWLYALFLSSRFVALDGRDEGSERERAARGSSGVAPQLA